MINNVIEIENENSAAGLATGSEYIGHDSMTAEASTSKPRYFFRYRLWMLFVLFIPAAFWANQFNANTRIIYSESKSTLWKQDLTHLKFDKLPDGTPTIRSLNVDDAFQAIGVSFAFGTPDRNEAAELEGPKTTPVLSDAVTRPVQASPAIPSGSPLDPKYLPPKKTNNSISAKPKQDVRRINPGFIGVSGYPFKFPPNASYPYSICCFEPDGAYSKRFKGQMTIRFHVPGKPKEAAGVKRIGFFAARLNHPEALEARLYSPSGDFLCRQSTIGKGCVFMSFESNKRIGRIEIQTIGLDEDYAITGLMFDKVK